ncbi:glycoside hydrolase family 9 protein [Actinotalea sp. K2]|uniref:glycoside hydrolase family 9 protein n=1 Tax=Actinotalea sp. K2 TaxID=2939438 RepID=UPI002017B317|nr:glycoside hydrolase family 9 protein [Actinotalea sp. K2]
MDPFSGVAAVDEGDQRRSVLCHRQRTRWGDFFVGELAGLDGPGVYSLEAADGISLPFEVGTGVHDRILDGYLDYTRAQRSAEEQPGVSGPLFLDDAKQDVDGAQVLAVGGWYDAGDHRQWTSTTALHLGALAAIAVEGPHAWRERARAEVNWGRDYFLHLVGDGGQVPDNVGGGALPPGFDLGTWWFENHSGTASDGSGSLPTDDLPSSGDERTVMMHRNPHAENVLVRELAASCPVGPDAQAARSRIVAERVWRRSAALPPESRTLFLASRLRAAAALLRLPRPIVSQKDVLELAEVLLRRQHVSADTEPGLSGYFMEESDVDAFRSIPYSCEPAHALLDASEVLDGEAQDRASRAVAAYIDAYLLADAESNPFGLPPYGVYLDPEDDRRQVFRAAGGGRGVRTFMAPWNRDLIVHGNSAVTMHQCHLLARAGVVAQRPDWTRAAERILHWATGANPEGLSLFMDIGYRHPVPFSPRRPNMPGAVVNGHIGRGNDTPYLETSNAVSWNTQEVYGVPAAYAAHAALWLNRAGTAPQHTTRSKDAS